MNQSLHLTKDRFAWIIFSYVILSALDVNNKSCLQHWEGAVIAFYNSLFRLYLYKIKRTLMLSLHLGYVSGVRNNSLACDQNVL